MKSPYIVYSLSKERATQKFNRNKLQNIIKDVDRFLHHCTTTNLNEPAKVVLTAYTAFDETDPAGKLLEIIHKTTERFGPGNVAPLAHHYPSGVPGSASKHSWAFSKHRLTELIEYIATNSPMPKANFGPLELFITFDFELTHTLTNQKLVNQQQSSHLLIWLSKGKSCSPTLFFPFDREDETFWNYIDNLKPYLPFELEEKYLRISHINKQGEIKSFKKIQRP